MDKLNYTLKSEEIQELKQKIRGIKRKVIRKLEKSKVIKRKRVVKSCSVLFQATILYIVEKLSFQRLSDVMAIKYKVSMSDTSWKKQISKVAPVIYGIMMEFLNSKSQTNKNTILGYSSVYALDATDITLEGKKGTILRAHTEYDISGQASFKALIADIHTGESAKLFSVKANSLYFADRAYGKTPQMGYMIENNADFVFRFSPSHVKMFSDAKCIQQIDFSLLLSAKDQISSFECFFKDKKRIRKIRVIISPIPKDKAETAVKKAKRKSNKKQYKISAKTLVYAQYLFLATSLSDDYSNQDIISAYRNRWQIELHFKRSKSLLRFHKLRRSSFFYAFNIVSIWVAVTAFVYSLFLPLFSHFSLVFSTFNAFSLLSFLIS